MNHVQKRLVSSAARLATSVSPSAVPVFPPTEAFAVKKNMIQRSDFDPDTWAALQPPPRSALFAFAHRAGLASVLDSADLIQQVCTHHSFLDLWRKHYPNKPEPRTNSQTAVLGNSLMGLFAAEYLHAKYPHLPTRVLKAAVTAQVGPATSASIAQEMGALQLLRWHREPLSETAPPVFQSEALASITRSLTGLIYQKRSLPSARQFVHSLFLTRQIDLRGMIKFEDPKRALYQMVKKFGRETPKSRLLKETGRFTNSPIFVVGVYSGADKLGEGFGSSLRMAEFRAAEDALHRVYMTQTPEDEIRLPSSTFPLGLGDVFRSDAQVQETSYSPVPLGISEILYSSSGRS